MVLHRPDGPGFGARRGTGAVATLPGRRNQHRRETAGTARPTAGRSDTGEGAGHRRIGVHAQPAPVASLGTAVRTDWGTGGRGRSAVQATTNCPVERGLLL